MKEKIEVLIIGAGVVGTNLMKELEKHKIEFAFYDPKVSHETHRKYRKISEQEKLGISARYGIICVPTNSNKDGSCDISIVTNVIEEWKDKIDTYILKSTVPPGTTDKLNSIYGDKIVFSPEYYGSTQHANTPHNFQIVGRGKSDFCKKEVCELYKRMSTGFDKLFVTSAKTAELVKYAENTWLAMQVTFFNQFYRIANTIGVDNEQFREALLLDERISRSHSFVYEDHPYYESHCLDKDLPAIVRFAEDFEGNKIDVEFLKNIIDTNNRFKLSFKGEYRE